MIYNMNMQIVFTLLTSIVVVRGEKCTNQFARGPIEYLDTHTIGNSTYALHGKYYEFDYSKVMEPSSPTELFEETEESTTGSTDSRMMAVLIEAVIQIIFWHFAVLYTRSYVKNNCMSSKWFVQWSKKPNGMGGETGADEIIQFLGIFVQHWVGGIFLSLAYYLSSPQLFITGALSEFAIELLDIKDIIMQRYVTRKGHWSSQKTPLSGVIILLMHHSGLFLSILPACIYYADNTHLHQIGMGFLGFSAFFIINFTFSSSRDVLDLQERGQFMVSSVAGLIVSVYFRWIVACPGIYWFFYYEWATMSTVIRVLMLTFLVIFKLFDLVTLFGCAAQVYLYMFGGKGTKKSSKITIDSLKRMPSTPLDLLRMNSAPNLANLY